MLKERGRGRGTFLGQTLLKVEPNTVKQVVKLVQKLNLIADTNMAE